MGMKTLKHLKLGMAAALVALAGVCFAAAPSFEKAEWGVTARGEKASLYTLKGKGGLEIVVSDYGGRLVKCLAAGRDGKVADVCLGWNTVGEYERFGCSMGTLVGRFGNRIADGRFALDGKTVQLPINEGAAPRHCNLHSGPDGWDTWVWQAAPFAKGDVVGIVLTRLSKDGESGFPGNVNAKVTYSVLPDNVWRLEYEMKTDAPTVLNPTHHVYWNLGGEASGDILGQWLTIFADQYTMTTPGLIPTQHANVKGTGFDFTESRPFGHWKTRMETDKSLAPTGNWYDHNFVLRGKNGEFRQAVELFDPPSGRVLEIWTTEPGLQMYGSQDFSEKYPAKEAGKRLVKYAGFVLETQHFPDSPNRPDFPTTVLRPGETFRSKTEYRFKTR